MTDWIPRVVALDIDGTLLKWVDGQTEHYETITDPVHDAVHRALDAGAHVVLASGRSPHGMTRIADLLHIPQGAYHHARIRAKVAAGLGEDD